MAKRRMLSRRISHSKKLNSVSLKAQLVWTWTIPYLDDFGCYTADAGDVKSAVFPIDKKVTEKIIKDSLIELKNAGLIFLYEVNNCLFQQFVNFNVFQTFRSDRSRVSEYPKYNQGTPVADMVCSKLGLGISEVKLREEQEVNFLSVFDQARVIYPGKKRGNEVEFGSFQTKHKNWKEILPLLKPAIENQIKWAETLTAAKEFTPNWKNFKTWINQSCWGEEPPIIPQTETPVEKAQRQNAEFKKTGTWTP